MTSNSNPRNLLRWAGIAGSSALIAAGVVNSTHSTTSTSTGSSSVSSDDGSAGTTGSGATQNNSGTQNSFGGLSVPQQNQAPVGGSHGS